MKTSTKNIIEECKGKLSGYIAMLSYQYVNICIKADPLTLLGVTVEMEGVEVNIEDVAMVGAGDDEFSIKVYPVSEKNILTIGKGIAIEHPEFKQEMETMTLDDGEELRYIKLTMPEVNEKRKKAMLDLVKVQHDACVTKLDVNNTLYTAKVTADVIGASEEDVEQAKKQMQETIDFHKKSCEDLTEDKKKEIEDAYAAYLEAEQKRQDEKAEQDAAVGKESVSNLKMS